MIQHSQTQIVVTDVSRMGGERVCLAGVDADGRTWRPEPENRLGLQRIDLSTATGKLIRTGSVIEFCGKPKDAIEPPHVEDVVYEGEIKLIRQANESMWIKAIRATCFPSVNAVFDNLIQRGRFVPPLSKTRSLGTIVPIASTVECSVTDTSKPAVRLKFTDSSGTEFVDWVINDLAFVDYVAHLLSSGKNHHGVETDVNVRLRKMPELFLRLGLTRPWSASGPEQCWTQITGIHSPRPPGTM